MLQDFIAQRIAILRIEKGVSARDMSLDLGMGVNYINNIENKKSNTTIEVFENICEYLQISYRDFFDAEKTSPYLQNELMSVTTGLQNTQIQAMIDIANGFQAVNKTK